MFSFFKNKFVVAILVLLLVAAGLAVFIFTKNRNLNPDHIVVDSIALNDKTHLRVAHAPTPEKGLVLFITNKEDSKANEDYAKQFAALSYYVAIIDHEALLNGSANETTHCVDIANQLTAINTTLQTRFQIGADQLPILIGMEDASATLYAALAQADKKNFHAAVGINFSPELKPHGALCDQKEFASDNSPMLIPVKRLPNSFYIFQDRNKNNVVDAAFTDKIANVKLTMEDSKEQALAEAIQILQWLDPRLADQISSDASDNDLPVIEVPVENATTTSEANDTMAVIITGDGGWAEIDKNIAKILAEKGIPTVALDSLSYFWKARTAEETTQDVETIISQYLEKWNKKKVILVGYSFGADVLPFITNKLGEETKKQLALVALLGMGKTAAFEFRLSSWMNADTDSSRLLILPEIEKMKWANSICIYGLDDEAANCLPTADLGVKVISMTGDHHFDEKYDELVNHIIENSKTPNQAPQ